MRKHPAPSAAARRQGGDIEQAQGAEQAEAEHHDGQQHLEPAVQCLRSGLHPRDWTSCCSSFPRTGRSPSWSTCRMTLFSTTLSATARARPSRLTSCASSLLEAVGKSQGIHSGCVHVQPSGSAAYQFAHRWHRTTYENAYTHCGNVRRATGKPTSRQFRRRCGCALVMRPC